MDTDRDKMQVLRKVPIECVVGEHEHALFVYQNKNEIKCRFCGAKGSINDAQDKKGNFRMEDGEFEKVWK